MSEYDLVTAAVAVIALVASFIALVVTWHYSKKQFLSAKESLSLDTFARALDEFADEKARGARRKVHQNFPDYTKEDYSSEKWSNKLGADEKTEKKTLNIAEDMEDPKPENREVRILTDKSEDKNEFEEVAVRADRVGFMFFTLDASPKFKKAYVDWLCFTYCDMWNKIAPHVEQERDFRVKYVPYLERLVYLAYPFCKKAIDNANKKAKKEEMKKAKIIVLNPALMTEILKKYKILWDC